MPSNPIGLNPPRLDWRQIQTDRVQVVYPAPLAEQGQRVANMAHYLWENHNESIGSDMTPITIILQNQPVISNGFVTVGPFRSEFYMTPPQFNPSTNWLDFLTIHEYRHVKQFGNSRRGLTQVAKTLFGSWVWGGMWALSLPRWFYEGDAVGMETALTRTGRGRLPAFNMEYRALLLNDIEYGYEKASAGSLRDFVPNWYRQGYYMTTYARKHFGKDIWRGVVADATSYRGLIYPFSKSLDKHTGLSTPELYRKTREEIDSLWEIQARDLQLTTSQRVNQDVKPTVRDYTNPHFLADGRIIAERGGYDKIPGFYLIDTAGAEQRLVNSGFRDAPPDATLSVSENRICWAERSFHPRWGNESYSIIKIYDLATAYKSKITGHSRYFAPDLSHSADRIVAVEVGEDLREALHILDVETREVIRRIPVPEDTHYAYPRWLEGDQQIVVVANRQEESFLKLIDLRTGNERLLTPSAPHQLSHPFPRGDYVYFSSAYTGINNIFAVHTAKDSLYQLTSSLLGAFQPSVSRDGQRLLYSEFDPQGYNLQEASLEDLKWQAYAIPGTYQGLSYDEVLAGQEGGTIVDKVPEREFPTRDYKSWRHLINPHSLLPYLSPPVYGMQLLSDDKLSNMSTDIGGFYNINEREWTTIGRLRYAGIFPVLTGGYRRAHRSSEQFNFSLIRDSVLTTNFYVEEWVENDAFFGFDIPLNLTAGSFVNSMNIGAGIHHISADTEETFLEPNARDTFTLRLDRVRFFDHLFNKPLIDENFQTLDLRFSFQALQRMARQHVVPRLGFNLNLRDRTTMGGENTTGSAFLGRADFFLPGILRNHGFYFTIMHQEEELLDNYQFPDLFFYPRGYDAFLTNGITKIGLNYSFPIVHPDIALGPAAFIKRIKGNIFYDNGNYNAPPFPPFLAQDTKIESLGFELRFDIRAFRLLEIDLGVRYSYLFDPGYIQRYFIPNPPAGSLENRHQFDFILFRISG